MSEANEAVAEAAKGGRTMTGKVISTKMQKTVSVAIERVVRHPVFGKYIRRTTKLLAHDEENSCREGDLVSIVECRPISRRKSWRVAEILQRAEFRLAEARRAEVAALSAKDVLLEGLELEHRDQILQRLVHRPHSKLC